MLKLVVSIFDKNTITLGSTRSYKQSNHLRVESECNVKVARESVYDAEMYRVLLNWLTKVHNYEVTGQWHLEDIYEDGDWHHLYCDLSIKKPDDPNPLALLELVATTSISKLKKHFDQVFQYAKNFAR